MNCQTFSPDRLKRGKSQQPAALAESFDVPRGMEIMLPIPQQMKELEKDKGEKKTSIMGNVWGWDEGSYTHAFLLWLRVAYSKDERH